ncbi:MAG: serine/threonine protein kinase, partial [Bryobacterales bacterium]|nr:serine/threonine protein kinase [Bryobacterales bacterium]
RDLKPSNILVDSSGRARLLDFGIARILDDNTGQTQTRERMLTPEYASPEQVRGMAQTTATDIYSLGAVLYKLLTGQPPHRFDPNSGEDIAWTICTREPTPAGSLNAAISKDLDSILAMTLRKEPESRYGTVDMLMEDIRAFLELRPVRARSMDSWYRTTKFLRRFWLPAAAASIAIAGLATGLVIAQRQRALAERRFNDVRHLSNKLLDVDVIVRQLPGSSAARQYIVNTSLDYLRRLSQDAASDPGLALELGTAYMRVGRVQGIPISPNLGQADNAEQSLRTAEKLIHTVLASDPNNRVAILRAAQISHDRMILAQERRPDTEALPLTRTSAQWLTKFLDMVPTQQMDNPDAEAAVIVGINVANGFSRDNLLDEATRILRRTIDLAVATGQPRQAGAARIVLARTLRAAGDLDAALVTIREAMALVQPPPGQTSLGVVNSFALTLITEGEILGEDEAVSLGRPAEAIPLFERGYRMAVELANRDAKDALSRMAVASRGFRYAGALRHKNPEAALRVCDEILRYCSEVKNNSRARRSEARAMSLSSRILVSLRRTAEARKRLDNAYSRLRELNLDPASTVELGSEAADALRASAELEAASGALPQAIESYTRLLHLIMAGKPNVDSDLHSAYRLADHYSSLTSLYGRAGRKAEAATFESRRVELWRAWERKLPGNSFVVRQLARTH